MVAFPTAACGKITFTSPQEDEESGVLFHEWILLALIGIPLLAAVVVRAFQRWLCCALQGWLLAGMMTTLFIGAISLLPQVGARQAILFNLTWIPQLGLSFSLYLDGLALLFVLVVTGMGAAIMAYGGYYFEDPKQSGLFFQLLLVFASSMLALVMAGNIITLFVAWELTSVISFLLISFKGADPEARSGALQAMMITGAGGLALFAGLLLIGSVVGSMELSSLLASGDVLRQHPWYSAVVILLMVGAFSKSAQFPLHFWLPGAMSAPTPASAYLHSATMVKAGIYLLLRFYPILGDTPLWEAGLVWVGALTTLISAVLAMWQMDLKGILAYTTISQLGSLVLLIGLPEGLGLKAALLGVLAHALYKGTLFLVAGSVDHSSGTRNIRELGGLVQIMPGFAVVAFIVALSMAGAPPLFGFVAKEALLEAVFDSPVVLVFVVMRAVLTVAIALRFAWDVFLRPLRRPLPQKEHHDHDFHHPYGDDAYDFSHTHSLPPGMVIGPTILALFSILLGIGIGPLVSPLIAAAIGKDVKLYLFPPGGINQVMAISLGALALGIVLFAIRRFWVRLDVPEWITGRKAYDAIVRSVEAMGDILLTSQNGKIRYYLSAIMLTVVALLSISMYDLRINLPSSLVQIQSVNDVLKAILLLITLGATLASIVFQQHLTAILVLAVAGYAVGGLFLLEPAPDVALVQFLVETLATVLVVLILTRTGARERRSAMRRLWKQTRWGVFRDILIATTTGAAVTYFALAAVIGPPTSDRVSRWYLENALPEVGASDVVAGIITDFRGTDTLIEITVFSLAALGVLTMLARPNPGKLIPWLQRTLKPGIVEIDGERDALKEDNERPEDLVHRSQLQDSMTLFAAYFILPLAFLIAGAHILYAGASPGDGFTAGVISGLGVALWFVVFGYEETRRRLRWLHPGPLIGVGLSIALINAFLPTLFGRSFLAFTLLTKGSLAEIKLASPLFFEIGICLVVFGGISAIIEAISHPREVEPL
jgi:NADH:ubiquinone oxidoreductase subunit 5 (subunit L)/multisubunit Na+/H+ antiporter MnhA subunit